MGRVVAYLRRRRLGERLDGLRAVTSAAWSPPIPSSLTCIYVSVPQGLLRDGEASERGIARTRVGPLQTRLRSLAILAA